MGNKKVRAKAKMGRGGADNPDSVISSIENAWEAMQDAINALEEGEQEQIRDAIN